MRLKKLEIVGFKSFADKIVIEFLDGITAIVGPNGCGKSNISDAIRWVLGEQSAKSIRGGRMPDVIFAGTSQRKPLNFAEVTLTFTEVNGALPVDFEEVAITRRLHRSGESEYFINKHSVRLKDVQSLLFDSGIGHQAYSIFEQGKIDQVIHQSAYERRAIFEEAAGIVRYLQRKKEALKKLEEVDGNFERVQDIFQEVEKRIGTLQAQATQAIHYKDIQHRLVFLEEGVCILRLQQLEEKGQNVAKQRVAFKINLESKQQHFEKLEQELKQEKEALLETEKMLRTKHAQVYKAQGEKELKNQEKKTHRERYQEALTQEKRWNQELEELRKGIEKRFVEKEQLQKRKNALAEEESVKKRLLEETKERYYANEKEVTQLRIQQQKAQQERLRFTQQESQVDGEKSQKQLKLEHMQERLKHIQARKQQAALYIDQFSKDLKSKKELLKQSSEQIDQWKQHYVECEKTLVNINQSHESQQQLLDKSQRQLLEKRARLNALHKLQEEWQGFSSGGKHLAQQAQQPKSPLFGKLKPLYELIQPLPGFEETFNTILRVYAQTLVAERKSDLETIAAYAKEHKLKDYSLFCQEDIQGDLSQHFLKEWNVVAAPKNYSGSFLAWQGGFIIDRLGVLFHYSSGEGDLFSREAELKTLEKDIQTLSEESQVLDHGLKELKLKKNEVQTSRSDWDKQIRKEEMKLVELNFGVQRAHGDLEKTQGESKSYEQETNTLQADMQQIEKILESLSVKVSEAQNQLKESDERFKIFEEQYQSFSKTLQDHRQVVQDHENAYQKAHRQLQDSLHALQLNELQHKEEQKQILRLQQEITTVVQLQKQMQEKELEKGKDLETLDELLKTVSKESSSVEQLSVKQQEKLKGFENSLRKIQSEMKDIEQKEHQLSVQTAQIESTKQGYEKELEDRFSKSLKEVLKEIVNLGVTLEQAEKEIKVLRQEISQTKDVNLAAIEELDQHRERAKFLSQEQQDLTQSKQELLKIISQLDLQSRKMFKDSFEQIRSHFQKNFKILFEGGEADLELKDAQDILEAGIEISAKPPGKQMRSIQLLSGGEKCLTAIALLFAIFEVKPSPFCVLDEMDAPLDDANVERFSKVVKQFTDRCQFIIITHNKRTMSMADVLFGVSMQEKGVSKLLSLAFVREKTAEAAIL